MNLLISQMILNQGGLLGGGLEATSSEYMSQQYTRNLILSLMNMNGLSNPNNFTGNLNTIATSINNKTQ